MHVLVMGEKPWKTDRVKKGQRLIEIQLGDLVVVGGQSFRVVRRLSNGRLVVRQFKTDEGRVE